MQQLKKRFQKDPVLPQLHQADRRAYFKELIFNMQNGHPVIQLKGNLVLTAP